MVDQLLRRFGIVLMIFMLPGLIVPAVAISQSPSEEVSVFQWLVVGLGYGAAFAGYVALTYFTVRAYRRRATAKRSSARAASPTGPRPAGRHPGTTLIIVGGSLVVVGVLSGLVSFFLPVSVEGPIVGAVRIFVPGLLAIGGLVVAIVGGAIALVASTTRPT